jgi:hypothetical protein
VTQWLIEEAAFAALDLWMAAERSGRNAEWRAQEQLQARHAEMLALREGLRGEVSDGVR